jgi:DNA-binding response OmpR family regulator
LHSGVVVSTVLAVDSEPDLSVTYYRLSTREGYRVITAPSRTRGLLALDREPPALVIVTLSLRDGNGLDVIRAARESEAPAAAILVSRFNNERFRQAAQEAGAATTLMDLVRSLAPTTEPARPTEAPGGEIGRRVPMHGLAPS